MPFSWALAPCFSVSLKRTWKWTWKQLREGGRWERTKRNETKMTNCFSFFFCFFLGGNGKRETGLNAWDPWRRGSQGRGYPVEEVSTFSLAFPRPLAMIPTVASCHFDCPLPNPHRIDIHISTRLTHPPILTKIHLPLSLIKAESCHLVDEFNSRTEFEVRFWWMFLPVSSAIRCLTLGWIDLSTSE